MVKVNLNIQSLESAAKEAFKESCYLAHRSIVEVISEPGAFPDFPDSDIVDTGNLRASQQPPEFSKGDTMATFRNTAAYSLYVYLGFQLRNGAEVKGRAWIAEGLKRAELEKTIAILLKAKLL